MNTIAEFVKNTTKYPVSELFGSIDAPDSKQKKAEKRCTEICEELYRFDCTVLSDVRAAYRELTVVLSISDDKFKIKQVRLEEMTGVLAYYIDKAVSKLDSMYKKDQLLMQYYKPFQVKSKVLKDELKAMLIQHYIGIDKNILLSGFDDWYKRTEANDTNK